MTSPSPSTAAAPPSAEARRCIKCGREIGPDETLCAICNRAGMATPSATQYHGTVVVAIVAGVAALAIAATWSLRGIGPYQVDVAGSAPVAPSGYEVTLTVTNEGTNPGRAKCQILALDAAGTRLRARSLVVGPIDGGHTVTVTETLSGLSEAPAQVTARCS